MTKVTYYMYSYDTCCMSRERMEMDGRDSTKCKKNQEKGQMELIEMLMIIRRKMNNVIFFILSTNRQWLDGCV